MSSSTGAIRSRTIPTAVLKHFAAKITSLEPHIKEVQAAEAVARMERIVEMGANKAQHLIEHGNEIKSRPHREWFTSQKETIPARERYLTEQEEIKEKIGTGMHRMTRKKMQMREAKQELAAMHEEATEQYEELVKDQRKSRQKRNKIYRESKEGSIGKLERAGLEEFAR